MSEQSVSPSLQRMPALDLSPEGVRRQWSQLGVARAIAAMEAEEPWTVDGKRTSDGRDVEQVVERLATQLSSVSRAAVGASITEVPTELIDVMGHLHSGRALSMLRWITEANDSAGNQLLRTAASQSSEMGVLLLERVTSLERRALLARVFSPQRMAAILDILDELGLTGTSEE